MIKTERLILRPWQGEDLEPFIQLNQDPRVMEFFPKLRSSSESEMDVERISSHIEQYGWGLWAVSLIENSEFIGFIGLANVLFDAHFTPAVEIGWRLGFNHWRKGYATEGALASLKYAFEVLKLDEVVSFTTVRNIRSRAVMEKIGMKYDQKGDFNHPKVEYGHSLRKCVLYRIKKDEWENKN